jgi:transposase-like protein
MWWARRVYTKMNIKTIIALPLTIVLGVVLAITLMTALQASTNAQSNNNQKKTEETKKETVYTYTAQPGDSYSKMARKAIQTYGIKNKVNLSQGRILYAETNLTQEAGSPQLIQGQKVEIKESTVKSWVDKAKALNNDQASKWDMYTTGVNFNTNNVGEVRS